MIAFEGALVGVGGLLIMGKRLGGPAQHHGIMLGAAAGILFGVSDIAIKAITGVVGDAGVVAGLLSPWTLTAVIASVAAFYASARGLQDGEAVPVIAVTGTAANVCRHRRRHHRLRRSAARRPDRHRRPGRRLPAGLRRRRADARARARRRRTPARSLLADPPLRLAAGPARPAAGRRRRGRGRSPAG